MRTHPVIRAIGLYHTQLANMSFDKIFDLTAGLYIFFNDIYHQLKRINTWNRSRFLSPSFLDMLQEEFPNKAI